MRRHIVYCMWFTPATKSKFGSRYLRQGSSECDEILHVARGRVDVPHHPDLWPLAQGSPSGAKILKGVKNFVMLFSKNPRWLHRSRWNLAWWRALGLAGLRRLDEFCPLFLGAQVLISDISHIFNRLRQNLGWLWTLVSIPWKILVNFGPFFSGSSNFRSQVSRTLLVGSPQNFAWLRVWPMDISSPNLANFDAGVRRCHAATCISPSLMHLLPFWLHVHLTLGSTSITGFL